ncbi:DUF6491 family protein [Asticcacaulis endophyticus]|uniref:Lipoprotein n=1 Tax=Asticcacaulis endophyticus TaxID=1395890 RepID=A0A918QEX5_9CAUL|nr:DUF6491 family protein [Asticcacaulis endophyticus]GGZ42937.1 hypothetical protein GCM10011273_32070 [Asticcacaulis endophyticus]
MRHRNGIIAAAMVSGLGLVVAGCAANPETVAQAPDPSGKDAQCFYVDDVRSYFTPNDDVMVVETHRKQNYALTIAPACMGLDNAGRIGLRSRGGLSRVCGPFDAEVLYAEFGDNRLKRCNITDVRAVTQAESDVLTGADKAKKRKADKKLAKEAAATAEPK